MAKKNDWKDRVGVVYSTNAEFQFQTEQTSEPNALTPQAQRLVVRLDRSGRAGKTVTLVTGYVGKTDDLENLAKVLKTKLGTGGSVKDGEILIQGDVRDKVVDALKKLNYSVKRAG